MELDCSSRLPHLVGFQGFGRSGPGEFRVSLLRRVAPWRRSSRHMLLSLQNHQQKTHKHKLSVFRRFEA